MSFKAIIYAFMMFGKPTFVGEPSPQTVLLPPNEGKLPFVTGKYIETLRVNEDVSGIEVSIIWLRGDDEVGIYRVREA